MASNRFTAEERSAASAAPAETSRALKALARQTARIQIASCSAAAMTFTGWAAAAGQFAQTLGDELLHRVDGETDSKELIARVADATTDHLRELTALPRAAAEHFDTRAVCASTDDKSRDGSTSRASPSRSG
jgi:hypothetical protein